MRPDECEGSGGYAWGYWPFSEMHWAQRLMGEVVVGPATPRRDEWSPRGSWEGSSSNRGGS